MKKKKFYFYIDESWDHSLSNINEDFPYFLLCWILISEEENNRMIQEFNDLKNEFFKSESVILHSRDIRKCNWPFQILFDLDIKKRFYENINSNIIWLDFYIISAGIKKLDYIKKYWKLADNPYQVSLSLILERMIFLLDKLSPDTSVEIIVEKRWKNEDKDLLEYYNKIKDLWTYYVSSPRFKQKIEKFDFRSKNQNDIWVQLADLCAYPLISFMRDNNASNPAFQILEKKIYTNHDWTKKYWLKIYP